jgi:subtilisin-like proprotein convertase family protein
MCQTETNSTVQNVGPAGGTVTTSIINFADDFTISDVNVTLNITHTWDSDLDVKLIAPDGVTEVILFEDVGLGGDNFIGTVLDDEAGTAITAGSAPFTGTFRPQGNLSDFDGMSSAGNWTLSITDDTNGDGGTLNSWDLQLCGNANLSVDDFLVEANMTIIYEGNKQFLIKLPGGTITDRLQMRVENMLGQTLLWKTLENEGNQGYEYRLDMSYASSGVYFVRIGNGKTENVKRIIVE